MTRAQDEYRNYQDSNHQERVQNHYRLNHAEQTLNVVNALKASYFTSPEIQMTITEAMVLLDSIVDQSDPDTNATQVVHAYQTAERVRQLFPDNKWLQITGFIHDAGKVLSHERMGGLPQHFVTGDTFPVGCSFSDKIVFSELFAANPDTKNPELSSNYGIYQPNCGFGRVSMSYGHDEYMYQVLVDNAAVHSLPEEALYIIRYHSFYAHHQAQAYNHLADETDRKMLQWLQAFQKCDLYSKTAVMPPMEELRAYFDPILAEYGLNKPLVWRRLTAPGTSSN